MVAGYLSSESRHVAFVGADYLSREIGISDIPKFFDSQVWTLHDIILNYQPHDYGTNGRSTRVLNYLKIQWLDSLGSGQETFVPVTSLYSWTIRLRKLSIRDSFGGAYTSVMDVANE